MLKIKTQTLNEPYPAAWAMIPAPHHHHPQEVVRVMAHPYRTTITIGCLADGHDPDHRAGQAAAEVAADAFITAAKRLNVSDFRSHDNWKAIARFIDEAVLDDDEAGEAAVLAFVVGPGWVSGVSCGDCALLARDIDDRPVLLTEGQRANPPFGSGDVNHHTFAAALGEKWQLTAFTDGIWRHVGWDDLLPLAKTADGKQLLDALTDEAPLGKEFYFDDAAAAVIWAGE